MVETKASHKMFEKVPKILGSAIIALAFYFNTPPSLFAEDYKSPPPQWGPIVVGEFGGELQYYLDCSGRKLGPQPDGGYCSRLCVGIVGIDDPNVKAILVQQGSCNAYSPSSPPQEPLLPQGELSMPKPVESSTPPIISYNTPEIRSQELQDLEGLLSCLSCLAVPLISYLLYLLLKPQPEEESDKTPKSSISPSKNQQSEDQQENESLLLGLLSDTFRITIVWPIKIIFGLAKLGWRFVRFLWNVGGGRGKQPKDALGKKSHN